MRLYVAIDQETFAALRQVASREHRRAQDQAAVILEHALRREDQAGLQDISAERESERSKCARSTTLNNSPASTEASAGARGNR